MKNLAFTKTFNFFTSIICGVLIFAPINIDAKPRNPFESNFVAPENANNSRSISLREIENILASNIPGRISNVSERNDNGRRIYIIRWEPTDVQYRGRIIIFEVDASNGQILSRRG